MALRLRPNMRADTTVCKPRRRIEMRIHGALHAFQADEEVIRGDRQHAAAVQE